VDKNQDDPKQNRVLSKERFSVLIGAKERRKVRARRTFRNSWFGFSMFGVIGWSVAMPTLAGIAFGVWLDAHRPGQYSWTLMLLVAGLGIGCLNAWHWISREHQTIRHEQEKNNHDD
jgi:ATP synthase protein I